MTFLVKPVVAIYRTAYRAPTEAFIKEQALNFLRFEPVVWTRDMSNIAHKENNQLPCFQLTSNSLSARLFFTLFGILSKFTFTKLLRTNVIHAHFGPDAAIIMPIAKRLGVPFVVTCHGFDVQQSKWTQFRSGKLTNILFLLREKKMYKEAARVIAVSEHLKKGLIKRGCPESKILVHYIGVNPSRFICDRRAREPYTLMNIARHIDLKAIDILLRGIAEIKKSIPEIKLLQIGEGEETQKLKQLAVELGISENIEWMGALSHDLIFSTLSRVSVYVHPGRMDSTGHVEAFGIAVIEAQSLGVPVVATDCGGISEAMVDGVTGFLFPQNDYFALAKSVINLLTNKLEYECMANSAKLNVAKKFDIRTQTKILEDLYYTINVKKPLGL